MIDALLRKRIEEATPEAVALIEAICRDLNGKPAAVTLTALTYVVAFGLLEVYMPGKPEEALHLFIKLTRLAMEHVKKEQDKRGHWAPAS